MGIKTNRIGSSVIYQGKDYTITDISNGKYTISNDKEEYIVFAQELKTKKSAPKPLKKTPIEKKAYTIPQYTEKRKKQLDEYAKLREQFLKENPICEARLKNCSEEATDIHHMEGKENGLLLKVESFKAVCRHCHIIITEQSRMAIDLGLSKSRIS